MKRKVLVTGGAGFVGSYLVQKLLDEKFEVVVVDDLSNVSEYVPPEGVEFIKMDISIQNSLNRIPAYDFQCVFHLAAQSSNAISFFDPYKDVLVNQLGTLNVLNFVKERGIGKIVYSSSMSAYGAPSSIPTNEDVCLMPNSFYAVHKLAGEHYCRIFANEYHLDYTIFRFYTVYGHGQNLLNANQGLLSIYLSYIVSGKPIILKGSKDRIRDIIHVTDVVDALFLSMKNDSSKNKTYNLGTGNSYTIEYLIDLLTLEFGYGPGEYPIIIEGGTPGDPFETKANMEKIKSDLNWMPKILAPEGIKLTVASYKPKHLRF